MSLSIPQQLACIALFSVLTMAALWLLQKRTKDAGVVDVSWSALLGLSAIFAALTGQGDLPSRLLVGVLGGVWGIRLALHLLFDRIIKGPEDGRYQSMRAVRGERVDAFFFWFFQAQALLVVILCVPFLLAAAGTAPGLHPLELTAAVVWLVGIVGESIADRQLARFKAQPGNRGKVCNTGLWRYSRHPNYFFEWLMWIAFALLATPASFGIAAWYAPSLMLLFILKITGIPPTEARAIASRGEAYREYQRTTSAFIPWFPRKSAA